MNDRLLLLENTLKSLDTGERPGTATGFASRFREAAPTRTPGITGVYDYVLRKIKTENGYEFILRRLPEELKQCVTDSYQNARFHLNYDCTGHNTTERLVLHGTEAELFHDAYTAHRQGHLLLRGDQAQR